MTALPPDPSRVRSVSEFVHQLSLLKVWAGNPSFEELRRRTGLPSSTLSDAVRVNRARLPKVDVVRRFVVACGGTAADLARWERAWRALSTGPGAPPSAGPHQVPTSGVRLVGRRTALDRLDLLRREAAVVVVVGMPGAGKTALALHWARRVLGTFDGHLYLDAGPATTSEALRSFLHALGVPSRDVPADTTSQVGLYRSLSHARRLLVVLDGARHAEQVRPLLPGGPDCLTLITSRDLLSGLLVREGAQRLSIGPLPSADAERLVTEALTADRGGGGGSGGGRHGEPRAARDLARLCGNLPLALRIAVTRLADYPHWTPAEYVARLGSGNVLDELEVAGDGMRTAFDLSYRALDAAARELFTTLAGAPHPDFTISDAAALAALPKADAARLLGALRRAHLIETTGTDRYTLHTLIRAYAEELARAAGPRSMSTRDLAAA